MRKTSRPQAHAGGAAMAAAPPLHGEPSAEAEPTPATAGASSPMAAAAPQRLIPGSSPSAPARPSPSLSSQPAHTAAVSQGDRVRLPSTATAPLSRPGGFSGTRPTGGPLSAHTTHRGVGPRPGGPTPSGQGPRTEPRPGQPSSQAPSSTGSGPAGSSLSNATTTCRPRELVP